MQIEFPKFNVRKEESDETYTRMFACGVYYGHEEIPRLEFCNEDLTVTSSGRIISTPLGNVTVTADDPSKTFPVLNPTTGETSMMTYGEFMWIFGQLWFSKMAEIEADKLVSPAP
jgi:hypothetical protein